MDSIDEFKNLSPLRTPTVVSTATATARLGSMRQVASTGALSSASGSGSASSPSRTGRNSPMPTMSVTEQIARNTRKSTVLNEKNALLILAIPDYDDYKILQPYSCRSLSNRAKFVGGKDFVTRHNPQEVNDFKMTYSRDMGNLNRHRSIVAPPNALFSALSGSDDNNNRSPTKTSAAALSFLASRGLQMSPRSTGGNSNNNNNNNTNNRLGGEIWRKTLTDRNKACWVLTQLGIDTLIGPEYRITSRLPVTMQSDSYDAASAVTCRSPLSRRPESPTMTFSGRESARIGIGVDLRDEKALATLSRAGAYSAASRPLSPPRSPYREPLPAASESTRSPTRGSSRPFEKQERTGDVNAEQFTSARRTDGVGCNSMSLNPASTNMCSPRSPCISPLKITDIFRHDHIPTSNGVGGPESPTLLPCAIEISPPCITLGMLTAGEVYLFPVRVRNVGTKQERYRVKYITATGGNHAATIAEANYDKDTARLAPGLAAITTLTLSFPQRGAIVGQLRIETEGTSGCDVRIEGTVR